MRGRGMLLAGFGIVLIALGLLFLVGAGGQVRRMAIGLAGLGLGAVATGWGIRMIREADRWSPEQVRSEVMNLARLKNGEVSSGDVEAVLGRRKGVGIEVLERLSAEGVAEPGVRQGDRYFVFPHLQPRLTVRFCQYCDAEYPITEERENCPNCGGVLETRVARRSFSEGEVFSMGDEDG